MHVQGVYTHHTPESGSSDQPVGAACYYLESIDNMPGRYRLDWVIAHTLAPRPVASELD